MQDRRRRDKQVRLWEGMTHGLSFFHEASAFGRRSRPELTCGAFPCSADLIP
jgi:hypothetical protein